MRSFLQYTAFSIVVFLFISGCTSTKNLASYDDTLKDDYVAQDEELWAVNQADKLHQEILENGLIYSDSSIDSYLESIKLRLLGNTDTATQRSIQVYVLRSPDVNAMALPNGNVYLNSGLFTILLKEAHLAAVLSHEISHITQRHSVKSVISRKNTVVGAHIADLLTGGFGLAYYPAMASLMGYSRELETEADLEGLKGLSQSGYQPEAMKELIELFKKQPGATQSRSAYSSHPSQNERLKDIKTALLKTLVETNNIANEKEFSSTKGMLMKLNVDMCLRSRLFYQALNVVDEAEKFYSRVSVVSYYRGEVYFGLHKYPKDAAIEKNWMETGKRKQKNKYTDSLKNKTHLNLEKAEEFYLESISSEEPYPPAMKRMGEIREISNNIEEAQKWYEKYLAADPEAKDRSRIIRKIKRLQTKGKT